MIFPDFPPTHTLVKKKLKTSESDKRGFTIIPVLQKVAKSQLLSDQEPLLQGLLRLGAL